MAELEQSMSSAEFVEWMAFYRVDAEFKSGHPPPIEYDDDSEHSAAIDALF